MLVLNRDHPEGGIETKEVEASLKKNFSVSIPSDGKTVVSLINKGFPFVLASPGSPVAQRILAAGCRYCAAGL